MNQIYSSLQVATTVQMAKKCGGKLIENVSIGVMYRCSLEIYVCRAMNSQYH